MHFTVPICPFKIRIILLFVMHILSIIFAKIFKVVARVYFILIIGCSG